MNENCFVSVQTMGGEHVQIPANIIDEFVTLRNQVLDCRLGEHLLLPLVSALTLSLCIQYLTECNDSRIFERLQHSELVFVAEELIYLDCKKVEEAFMSYFNKTIQNMTDDHFYTCFDIQSDFSKNEKRKLDKEIKWLQGIYF